jgi:hypothetical protein
MRARPGLWEPWVGNDPWPPGPTYETDDSKLTQIAGITAGGVQDLRLEPHLEGSLASIWDKSHDLLKDMLPSKEAQLLPADVGVRSEGNWAVIGIGRKS